MEKRKFFGYMNIDTINLNGNQMYNLPLRNFKSPRNVVSFTHMDIHKKEGLCGFNLSFSLFLNMKWESKLIFN